MGASILPILLLLLLLLAGTAVGRPCKTIFYFSATSYYPYGSLARNPNSDSLFVNPQHLTLVFAAATTTTTTSRSLDHLNSLNFNSESIVDEDPESTSMLASSALPLKLYSSVPNSIRQRTRDIMSVVGALLFGVACGALTAATMYFVWAVFSPCDLGLEDVSSSEDEEYDEDVTAAKKLGYVAIPTKPKVAGDELKKPAPEAAEVV